MKSKRREHSFWQSYSDLAMGVMAVFILILIIILQQREKQSADFASEMMTLVERSQEIIENQNKVEKLLENLFSENECQLILKNSKLSVESKSGEQAQLYASAHSELNRDGIAALESCKENFRKLTQWLKPDGSLATKDIAASDGHIIKETAKVQAQLRDGIEALVLQGNTDRQRFKRAPAIINPDPDKSQVKLNKVARSFVDNAYLGAERSRQALGHLLNLLDDSSTDEDSALEILMGRVRTESPSFGRYQAGPKVWRTGQCLDGEDECPEARNLSLILRWKKEALRKPFKEFKDLFCELLQNDKIHLLKSHKKTDGGKTVDELKASVCGEHG